MTSSGRSSHGRGRGYRQSRLRGSSVPSSVSTPSDLLRYVERGTAASTHDQFPQSYVPDPDFYFPEDPSNPAYSLHTQDVPDQDDASSRPHINPTHISLENLLVAPGRKELLPNLDPSDSENTIWFDRDNDGSLVRKICSILRGGFKGPWYSWTKTPVEAKDAYFIKFAQAYYWDPIITDLVRDEFNKICVNRMKGIVTSMKRNAKCPGWLDGKIWQVMVEHWSTDAAKKRSAAASAARNSHRDGLGPHKHVSGQKTYYRVKQDLAKELQRTPTLSEVFIKTHTKSDGSFVDYKAKNIVEAYEHTVSDKLSQADSNLPDDSTEPTLLSPAEMDQLFLQTTTKDSRGREYGLGSLSRTYGSSTKKRSGSSTFIPPVMEDYKREVDKKLEDSQKEMASLRHQLSTYEMLLGYMKERDPTFAAYLATNPVPHPSTNIAGPSGASETQPPDTNDFVNDFNL